MSEENLGLGKKFNLSSLHVVSAPIRDKITIDEYNNAQYSEFLSKLNEIMFNIFKKGALEAGYTFSSLQYAFISKSGADQEVGLSILNKLLQTYFQTFNSPYLYSVFLHAFIIRWFRMILILDLKSNEIIEFMNVNQSWRNTQKALRIFKFVDKPFRLIPSLDPDNPVIPLTNPEDQQMIDDLIKNNKNTAKQAGFEFIKFYHLIIKRVLKEEESLRYLFEIQSIIGPILVIEYSKDEITDFITGIGEYYFNLQKEIKSVIRKYEDVLTVSKIDRARKKWIANTKFSGIEFSKIVREHLIKNKNVI